MSYGILCVVSNRISIPEVVGDFAVKVDLHDLDDLKELNDKILKVIND